MVSALDWGSRGRRFESGRPDEKMRSRSTLREDVSRTFPADAVALRDVRQFLRERARQAGIPRETLSDLLIAASEACTNVIRHARVSDMKVRWMVEGGRLEVEVEDSGVYVDRPAEPASAGGFGVTLMRTLMDEVTILRGDHGHPGTRVVLSKRLPSSLSASSGPRRSGLRSSRLHGGAAPVRPTRDEDRKRRRIPRRNVVGAGIAAALLAGGVAFGAVAIAHRAHPGTSLTSNTSSVGSDHHSTPPSPATSPGPRRHHGAHGSQGSRTQPGHATSTTGPASSVQSPAPATRSSSQLPSPGAGALPALSCPARPLLGVYAPDRLAVLKACTWVVGRVTSVSLQNDGDQRVVVVGSDGVRRVVEIILGQHLPVPGVGEHVAALGTLVRDRKAGWRGLQPAWAIDYLDRGRVIRSLPPASPLYKPGEVCVPSDPPVCTEVSTPSVGVPTPSLSPIP